MIFDSLVQYRTGYARTQGFFSRFFYCNFHIGRHDYGMADQIGRAYLDDALSEFRKMKALAEHALAQISDEDLFRTIDEESNSLAIIIKHMTGNMRSRWTDFLTSDGEKEWRNRDTEFLLTDEDTRESLMLRWEREWKLVLDTLSSLSPEQVLAQVTIRHEPYTILRAINRQLTHYAYHVGQIVFLAKHLRTKDWQSLSIPRNRSDQFNSEMHKKHS